MTQQSQDPYQSLMTFLYSLKAVQESNYSKPERYKYASLTDLILDCGMVMSPFMPRPKPNLTMLKHCYYASYQACQNNPNLYYCEGYAIPCDVNFPLLHAWNCNADGKVFDYTFRNGGAVYFGIPFKREWTFQFIEKRKVKDPLTIAILEGNYIEDFNLIVDGMPDGAVKKIEQRQLC